MLHGRCGVTGRLSMDSIRGDLREQKIDKSPNLARQVVATRVGHVDRLSAVVAPLGEDVDESAGVEVVFQQD